MMRVLAAAVGLLVAVGLARAGEPIAGTWRLERQELNGEKGNFDPLTLRIAQSGDKLAFAFSVPINNIHYVSMTYTVRLDGTEADVKKYAHHEELFAWMITPGLGLLLLETLLRHTRLRRLP